MSILSDFEEVSISKIKVGKRFRKELKNIDALCKSIKSIGMLHPITITLDDYLVAGRRRLEAAKKLGLNTIPTRRLQINHKEIAFE